MVCVTICVINDFRALWEKSYLCVLGQSIHYSGGTLKGNVVLKRDLCAMENVVDDMIGFLFLLCPTP